jgi:hypothetical protein
MDIIKSEDIGYFIRSNTKEAFLLWVHSMIDLFKRGFKYSDYDETLSNINHYKQVLSDCMAVSDFRIPKSVEVAFAVFLRLLIEEIGE